jgi:hypothetical protein
VVTVPVPPKAPSKRRRRNVPASYGAATPVKAGPAARQPDDLGFTAHPLIQSLWDALADSCESRFFSACDWQRARMELWFGNTLMRGKPTAAAWTVFQHGLSELLVSPSQKRRLGIELAPPDPAEDAVVLTLLDRYQESLKPE